MVTYPLQSITVEEAMQLQFKVIDCITREFPGHEILTRGDLGVVPGLNKPVTTMKAEKVIARIFDAEAAMLVRGAGTDAIADALYSVIKAGETLLVHTSPIYSTTKLTVDRQGLKTVAADFNDLEDIRRVMGEHPEIKAALVQYTRQSMTDSYDMEEVIRTIKACRDIPIVTDDNYAVMKVTKNGSQCGADLACFSTFKLQGPEGIGCIVGKKEYIDFLVKLNYSGGSQTQGHEALEVLRGMVYAPVALAIQAQVNDRLVERLWAASCPASRMPSWPTPRARSCWWNSRSRSLSRFSSRPRSWALPPTPSAQRAATSWFPCSTGSPAPSAPPIPPLPSG